MFFMDNICCIRCGSKRIEEHGLDFSKKVVCYYCADCLLRFTNFEFNVTSRLKYKLLLLQHNEFPNINKIIEASYKGLKQKKDVEKIFPESHLKDQVFSSKEPFEVLGNICFIEALCDINQKIQ